MNYKFSVLILLLAFISVSAKELISINHTLPLDKVIAIVNQEVITQKELEQIIDQVVQGLKRQKQTIPPLTSLRAQILEQMVMQKIQLQRAKELGIIINNDQVMEVVQNIATEQDLSLEQYRQAVLASGISWPEFKEQAARELTINQLREHEVAQKLELNKPLSSNQALLTHDTKEALQQLQVEHILIRVGDGLSEMDAYNRLVDIKKRLAKNQGTFNEYAQQYSMDGSAAQGGRLGWISPNATVPEFRNALLALNKGEISDPIRTEYGYHLIHLVDKRQLDVNDEQQRAYIQQNLSQQKLQQATEEWLQILLDQSYVEYFE